LERRDDPPPATGSKARELLRRAVRAVAIAILRTIYRIRATGLERLPAGGGLLVANHLSHVDALILGVALSHRRVHFLMHRSFFAVPVVGAFSRLMGAMPIAAEDSPEEKAASLARAAETARAGGLVGIFAEGGISRSGALLPFARGLETIAREARVPIVPVALDRLWGSLFSFSGGRFFWKWPRRVPYPVEVSIGAPMSFDSERWQVRGAVAELVARSREERAPRTRSLAYRFLQSARKHAGAVAIVDAEGRTLTYRALLREALVLRAVLRRAPRGRGGIGIRLAPVLDAAVAHVATALAGRIAVPLDGSGRGEELVDLEIGDLGALRARATARDRLGARVLGCCPGPVLARRLDPVRDALDPAAVFFAHARGGAPRAVLHSHASLASNAQSLAQMFRFGPGGRVLGVLPFSSVLGTVATLWIPLFSGGCAVLGAPAGIGALCRRERPGVVLGTPALYREWLAALEPADVSSVELFFCGGEPLDSDLASAWKARFGVELCEGYGCTELSAVVAVNLPGIESSDARQNASKPGTAGRAIPGVALRIVDPQSLEEVPPDRPGLLLARGPGRMLGYPGDERGTAAAFRDGWFVTGDEAILDRDAFLTITRPRAG
jgi:acyl-[acyl-carrier-protein]-phospholipid O-acyltransferase/long-chain-fatty-acid--[acyl-carrier-protein] ligase